ncbi:MAG: hypothetical protein Q8Q08_11310, partial [Candidatus Omnitrophota bacterium]|nr:hypothetical protein [Candidatus Omnitrophota bacterium]
QDGFKAVHEARMVVKGHRVAVEKKRKDLKADALAFGKLVDGEAKRITAMLEPIESHLQAEEDKITKELERIKAEEEEAERQRVQDRVDELAKYGKQYPFSGVQFMDDFMYTDMLTKAKSDWETEQARIKKEEEDRKIEINRLADQKTDQDRIAEEQRIAQARIDVEKKALEDAKRAEQDRQTRIAFEIQAKEDARINAEKAAKERSEREAWEKFEAEEKAKAAAKIKEMLKPDKAKLKEWTDMLWHIAAPELANAKAKEIAGEILDGLSLILDSYKARIDAL